MSTADAILALLDQESAALNMTGLVSMLPEHDGTEIKRLTNDLYMQGRIHRVPVMGPSNRYYVFYSAQVRTTNARTAVPTEPLTADQAVEVLASAGWTPEPEVVTVEERRAPERRRLSAMDVIDRWRLGYRLSRVIEIVGGSRNRKLTRDDAATAIRMIREHVRGGE
jgi:hypothetical protein